MDADIRVRPAGLMAFTVAPIDANSRLRVWVSPTIADLAVL